MSKSLISYRLKLRAQFTKWIKHPLFLLFFILAGLSCQRQEPLNLDSIDCADCYQTKPEWLPLTIVVSIDDENPAVPIWVYKGKIEDGVLDWVDTVRIEDYWVEVHPDEYYSVEAKYKNGDITIFAVDGDRINAKYSSSDCDQGCYYQTGGYIDVRLLK